MSSQKEARSPEVFQLPSGGADSHAHLASSRLWPDFDLVMERARRVGISAIGQIFLSHAQYRECIEVMAACPELFFTLGIHPSDGLKWGQEEAVLQAQALQNDDRLRAVGETGLDFFHDDCPAEMQDFLFRGQLRLAKRLDKPVIIHSRDAFAQTIQVLDDEKFTDYPVLWHCFGGDSAQAEALLRRGWHISIPGPVTYPANAVLREAVKHIPLDKIMVETDCPYLAPQEWRGKTNEPALCAFAAVTVAREKGLDPAELWLACGENTRRFFGV